MLTQEFCKKFRISEYNMTITACYPHYPSLITTHISFIMDMIFTDNEHLKFDVKNQEIINIVSILEDKVIDYSKILRKDKILKLKEKM
jgi:hypothetical protein